MRKFASSISNSFTQDFFFMDFENGGENQFMMTPALAKLFSELLKKNLADYEEKYGEISTETTSEVNEESVLQAESETLYI